MVDTLASGASGGNPVEVQILFSVPYILINSPNKIFKAIQRKFIILSEQ